MKKIIKLKESDLNRIVKRVLKEQSDDRFGDEFPDYRADIYGRGEMFDKNSRVDTEYNEDDWEDWFEIGGNPDEDDYEEYLNSPVGKDPNSRWSSNIPGRKPNPREWDISRSKDWWDQEKRSRLDRTGSSALKVKKRRSK